MIKRSKIVLSFHVFEPLRDAHEQVVTCVAAIDAMVAVGVNELMEGLVCLYKGFCHFGCVAQVYVIVSRTMADEQCTMEL